MLTGGGESRFEVRLLGPVSAERGPRLLEIGGPKQRAVLATLALDPGRVVSVGALLDSVWGDDPPGGAAKTLQVYVANLRRGLEPDRAPGSPPAVLVTREPGYSLAVHSDQVDAARLEHAVTRARDLVAAGQLDDAARALRGALDDWRGAPLAGLEALPIHDASAARLEELRLDALELCCGAELELGFAGALIPELEALVHEAPYRERVRALLVRALYACGRQRDALSAFQDARHTLLEDLGIEPGPELRDLERRVLVQDRALDIVGLATPRRRQGQDDVAVVRKRVSIVAATGAALDAAALSSVAAQHAGTIIERGQELVVTAFGTPHLGLDDADRAAAMALALRDGGVAVGMATGFATAAGATVSGAPVSRAKELSASAPPGRAMIDATSRDLLAGRASVEPAGGAWILLALRALPPGSEATGPFVGRDGEVDLLASVWQVVERGRRSAVVTLVGDPGLGTTRLALELGARVQAPLLRVALDPTTAPEALLDVMSTASSGSIVLLEHVHRAPRTAAWALATWMDAMPETAVLFVATATPALRAAAPTWPGAVPLAMRLDVPPLDDEASARLAAHLLGDEVAGARAATVTALAGGNPLFIAELAQHLASGADPTEVLPDRLGTLVAGRIDRLGPAARRALEAVVVAGGAVDARRLDDLVREAGSDVDELVSARLVTIDDDGAITVHQIVADVVITAIPDERAVAFHERAAEVASSLTGRAAHLEQAARRSSGADVGAAASAAIDALAELAWRNWSRGDVESSVDAVHRAVEIATRSSVDVVGSVRAARRRLASELVAGHLARHRFARSLRASVGAWDVNRPVELDLVEAARSIGGATSDVALRDRCEAIVAALASEAGDQGSSESSSA